MELIKYPRTRHLNGSCLQIGDEMLQYIDFTEIKDQFVVLEEKIDGANTGICFNQSGKLYLQSRGHYLNGGHQEKQFALFKSWAACFQRQLFSVLQDRYILYGEWMYAKHTIFYDALPHYFMEFDIYDRENQYFLSTQKRRELLKKIPFVHSVFVLYEGKLSSMEELLSFLGKSHFKSDHAWKELENQCREQKLSFDLVKKQTDLSDLMEGIYIKREQEDRVLDRMKYVRNSFLNTILDSETHWKDRPILPNKLKEGTDLFQIERKEEK